MALNLIKKDKSHSVVSIKLDEQEFHNIFKEYYAALCSFAFQYMEDADMSADIVQDVFAKLWQIRDDFFYLHQVKAFLYTAVRNHALNELEHSKVAHEYEQKIIAKKADAFFLDAIVEEETFRILSEAIEKLPTQMRAIMQLALEGKKNAEIAERLNVSSEKVVGKPEDGIEPVETECEIGQGFCQIVPAADVGLLMEQNIAPVGFR